jgi:uncharacterized membrane protein (UPF0127 family)
MERGRLLKAVSLKLQGGREVAAKAWRTEDVSERIEGWLRRDSVEPGEGLLIVPCSSVHSFGMHFDIDLCFVDENLRVTKVSALKRNRMAWAPLKFMLLPWRSGVLELPWGGAAGLKAGDQLELVERAA